MKSLKTGKTPIKTAFDEQGLTNELAELEMLLDYCVLPPTKVRRLFQVRQLLERIETLKFGI